MHPATKMHEKLTKIVVCLLKLSCMLETLYMHQAHKACTVRCDRALTFYTLYVGDSSHIEESNRNYIGK